MHLVTDPADLRPAHYGAAAALGNFDGIHPGHQTVIAAAHAAANPAAPLKAVIAFEPHPRQYFRPDDPPFRLTSLHGKARLLQELGTDLFIALTFDKALAETSAEDFAHRILGQELKVGHVAVGSDFRFGHRRTGDAEFLQKAGAAAGYGVTVVDHASPSTYIRPPIRKGDVVRANTRLGRAWSIDGVVVKGAQRGRQIGFPTINVPLGNFVRPRFGVYAVTVTYIDGGQDRTVAGVANLGVRPTFGGGDAGLEAYLFDFDGDLYGVHVDVALLDFIRPELSFDGLDALKAQIAADTHTARRIHAARSA